MLLRSAEARAKFLEKVSAATNDDTLIEAALNVVYHLEARRTEEVTITLLLLGTWRERSLRALPLVSRIRLQKAAQRISTLGYRFEVASPPLEEGHLANRRQS
jgi:hypothetical protein